MNVLTSRRLRAHHTILAALLLGLAGCSSSGSSGATAQSASTATSTDGSAVASTTAGTADTSADPNGGITSTTSSAAASTGSAGGSARTDDACTLLSSDQVEAAVGTAGPYTGAHEDPADDGSAVWGCTWGTHTSSADIRQVTAATFESTPDPSNITTAPVPGIGDKARLDTMNPDGRNPEILFAVGGAYYEVQVAVSRSELGAANAAQEETAERMLAKLLVPKLAS
jgi:hypothetical protein